jgi:glycogen operon protein
VKCLGVRLAGDIINEVDERGEAIVGDTLLLLLNAHWEEIPFTLPATKDGQVWESMIDTRDDYLPLRVCRGGEKYPLYGRTLALLRTNRPTATGQPTSPIQAEQMRRDTRPKQPST